MYKEMLTQLKTPALRLLSHSSAQLFFLLSLKGNQRILTGIKFNAIVTIKFIGKSKFACLVWDDHHAYHKYIMRVRFGGCKDRPPVQHQI